MGGSGSATDAGGATIAIEGKDVTVRGNGRLIVCRLVFFHPFQGDQCELIKIKCDFIIILIIIIPYPGIHSFILIQYHLQPFHLFQQNFMLRK